MRRIRIDSFPSASRVIINDVQEDFLMFSDVSPSADERRSML
jgi:hypothetical protein